MGTNLMPGILIDETKKGEVMSIEERQQQQLDAALKELDGLPSAIGKKLKPLAEFLKLQQQINNRNTKVEAMKIDYSKCSVELMREHGMHADADRLEGLNIAISEAHHGDNT
ncbi:MAG TPA: hypothetical protein VK149_12520 [Sideroxyarcus sp.]|nr:hypothetical protein [Sideroxyarcus sp.]